MRHRRLARYYRAIVLSFSSIITFIAVALCIWGAFIVMRAKKREIETQIYLNPAATLVLGCFILVVGITGFLGAFSKRKIPLLTFAALLTVLVCAEAAIGIMLIINRSAIKRVIKDHTLDAAAKLEERKNNFFINWIYDIGDSISFDLIFHAITTNFLKMGTFLIGMCFFQFYVVQVAIILTALLEQINYYIYDI